MCGPDLGDSCPYDSGALGQSHTHRQTEEESGRRTSANHRERLHRKPTPPDLGLGHLPSEQREKELALLK